MKVLIACEFSGRVREAFRAKGHDAWSCDLRRAEDGGPHIQRDVTDVLDQGWDLMIAHPPCTYLAASGARWWKDRQEEQAKAVEFVEMLWSTPIEKIAIENPIGCLPQYIGLYTQVVHPYYWGDPVTKATCLWLKNLPPLTSHGTWVSKLELRDNIHREPPGPNRRKNRSRTFLGLARAMAEQWG